MPHIKKISFFCLFCILATTLFLVDKKPKPTKAITKVIVQGNTYLIPTGYLSNKDDLDKVQQKTVTIDLLYPSFKPAINKRSWDELYDKGQAIRILIKTTSVTAKDVIKRYKKRAQEEHFRVTTDGAITKYFPQGDSIFYEYLYDQDDLVIFLTCTQRVNKKRGVDTCVNHYSELPGNVHFTYMFVDKLLPLLLEIDNKSKQFILSIKE